jgi:hypothetical protein
MLKFRSDGFALKIKGAPPTEWTMPQRITESAIETMEEQIEETPQKPQ